MQKCVLLFHGKSKQHILVELKENVINFVKDYFDLHDEFITGETTLRKDLGLSSFELLEMCCSLETEFNVRVSEANLRRVETIDDVVNSIYLAIN